tara:strand:- start:288618 stop:289217 length:600 start_codon:yes stop_codon:yes gene_type:complete
MTKATLLIYAKPPRMGLAKTRLAAGLGQTEARRVAHMTLARTMQAASAGHWTSLLYTAPDKALGDSISGLWPASLARRSQGHGGLTERLDKGLAEAPPGPVLFIGADAPDLSPALLRAAIRTLQNHDAVFGPARDGGFWLFGLNKGPRTRSPFGKVRWSGPHAMEDVWSNLPPHARVGLLPMLIDIDEADDWHAWNAAR